MIENLPRFRTDLLAHYDRNKRTLPWRGATDPYRILVSEMMLQQTRVDTVRDYYVAWMKRFPNVGALASAAEADVLKAWEGLGYYRRARNLHRSAQVVRERWDGEIPSDLEQLRELPGVGAYTAGAVASIAFGVAVPAVDGNVRRVLARLYDVPKPGAGWLRDTAALLVDPIRPGDWNQALMELGATVCTPRTPQCATCPVAWACAARQAGTVDSRPAPQGKRPPRPVIFALAVLRAASGAVLLVKRPSEGLLGGMWALPEREVAAVGQAEEAAVAVAAELGVNAAPASRCALPSVRHRFSHIDATYIPWLLDLTATPDPKAGAAPSYEEGALCWVTSDQLGDVALPVAQRSVLESV